MKKHYFIWNIKKYTDLVTNLATRDIRNSGILDSNNPIYLRNIWKRFKGENLVWGRIFTKSERKTKSYFINNTIFLPFTEISSSLESLINISLYIDFPVPLEYKTDISQWTYLRYHIENHLHEIYILKIRLNRYISWLKDCYNHNSDSVKVRSELDKIKAIIDSEFKWIIDTRDEHVHEERFSDNKLDQISYLELLTKSTDIAFVERLESVLEVAHLEWKDKWEWVMNKNIDSLIDILDAYFWWILSILQDPKNKDDIIYPDDIK